MTGSDRRWTVLLWLLALALPVGWATQSLLFTGRTEWRAVQRQLSSPLLLVTAAGLRADHLHHLGYPRDTSPVLDEIAHQGITFRGAYASSNESRATAAALMTARCPEVTGVRDAEDRLPPGPRTLAERLTERGYHCVALVSDPDLAGAGLERGFARFEVLEAPVTAESVLNAAREAIDAAPHGNWFVWADLPDLLRPSGGAGADAAPFAGDMPAGFGDAALLAGHFDPRAYTDLGWGPRERRWLVDRYDAALHRMDAAIGRFLDGLADAFVLETMTLAITGTRGERLDDRPGLDFAHGVDLYEHSIHVPLILRVPARHVRGLRLERLAHSVDFGPTMLEMVARVPNGPAAWPGASGQSLAHGTRFQLAGSPRVHVEGRHRGSTAVAHGVIAISGNDRYKLIQSEDGTLREFYALTPDPGERTNHAQHQRHRADALSNHIDAWRATCTVR